MPPRAALLAVLVALVVTGCGSGGSPRSAAQAPAGSLRALWHGGGEAVALVPGAADFAPGRIRYSFLVVARDGRSVERPTARVWVARSLEERPFQRTTATLEQVGVKGAHVDEDDVSALYVTHFTAPGPGKYWVVAEPVGGTPIRGLGGAIVNARSASPAVGSRALASRTPTLASAHGDLAKLTTREPPDRELLRTSVAQALAAHEPFVVVFATPAFCTSRTCGPVVDVVDAVRKRFGNKRMRFIHVEIYRDNDPARGPNRWVRQWRLPSEPWAFVVGRDGRIAAKFEGSFSVRELAAAVGRVA